ncbi:MAG: hypothetical protein IKP36_13405 [Bacteroidaceae bacterium]|nr:hypothetical protein [Bacteroidaceae bacterium]
MKRKNYLTILLFAAACASTSILCSCGDDEPEIIPVSNGGGSSGGNSGGSSGSGSGGNSEGESGTTDGHEWINLGLPSGTLWATCNVGATKPEEYGDYFAWGETTGYKSGKTRFYWDTYKWCYGGSEVNLTKYCTDMNYGTVDDKTELEPSDDAATVNWSKAWQTPSIDQVIELIDNTTSTYTSEKGVNGMKFTSKSNGQSIFLPAAGQNLGNDFLRKNDLGIYWTRSLYTNEVIKAYNLNFGSNGGMFSYYWDWRNHGNSVRPVRKK